MWKFVLSDNVKYISLYASLLFNDERFSIIRQTLDN